MICTYKDDAYKFAAIIRNLVCLVMWQLKFDHFKINGT